MGLFLGENLRRNIIFILFTFFFWQVNLAITQNAYGAKGGEKVSLDLHQCIKMALSRSLTLAQGIQKLKNREQEIREVRGTAYPQLEFEANYTRIGNITKFDFGDGNKVSFTPEDNYVTKLMLTQLLYSGGQVKAALRLAESAKKSIELEQEFTREMTIMLVTIDFYNALLANEMIDVAEETVKTVKAHLKNVYEMKKEGLVSEFDVLRAEVELANVKPLLIKSKNGRKNAFARLADIIQWDKDVETLSVKGSFDLTESKINEKEIFSLALNNRWELQILNANLSVMRENVSIKKGAFKPSLVFFSNYDWSNDELDLATGNTKWNEGWNLGLVANWKLFTGFQTSAKVAKTEGDLKILEIEKKKLINSINLEVTEAINNYHVSRELLQSQKKNIHQARRGLEIAEVRFKQGISTQLEVMDSRTALTKARSDYAITMHNYTLSKISLEKVTGLIFKTWNEQKLKSNN